jgi:hypothetical protein
VTTGPPGSVPAARASNAGGQGDELRTTQPVVARPRRKCKRECADAMRLACVCLSYEELAEIDLEAVRDNSFTPRFRWKGRKHEVREFISWVLSVFGIVADRTGVPVIWCFMHPNGLSETWAIPATGEAAKDREGGGAVP